LRLIEEIKNCDKQQGGGRRQIGAKGYAGDEGAQPHAVQMASLIQIGSGKVLTRRNFVLKDADSLCVRYAIFRILERGAGEIPKTRLHRFKEQKG
jgi:hypothetical protein